LGVALWPCGVPPRLFIPSIPLDNGAMDTGLTAVKVALAMRGASA
jgi:hypothetical protein